MCPVAPLIVKLLNPVHVLMPVTGCGSKEPHHTQTPASALVLRVHGPKLAMHVQKHACQVHVLKLAL